jgi:uncharacterized protein (TIGR02118 family)
MVKISILYPQTPGARFEMDYYLHTHMPMSIGHLSAHEGFRGVSVERGVAGQDPGAPPPFVALCHFLFESLEDFVAAFTPHAALLQGDMPNYTNIAPVIQISAVEISETRAVAPGRANH